MYMLKQGRRTLAESKGHRPGLCFPVEMSAFEPEDQADDGIAEGREVVRRLLSARE